MSESPVTAMTPEPLEGALTGADDRLLEPLDVAPGRNSAAAAHRPAHPSRPYLANERRQLQAQSEQAPLTPRQLGYAGG